MKKGIALAIGLFLTLSGSAFAAEEQPLVKNEYGYLDLGLGPAPFPIPQFGGGYRFQNGSNGFDANLMVSTIVEATGVKLGLHYLHYMHPDISKQFYVGAGPAVIEMFSRRNHSGLALAPEFIFGKQYTSDTGSQRHFQANLIWPAICFDHSNYRNHHNALWYPLLSFSYGWGF